MNSVTTKGGDRGETDGPAGMRVPKNDPFIALVGALDEVNAQLGICNGHIDERISELEIGADIASINNDSTKEQEFRENALLVAKASSVVEWTQHKLLDMGAELYTGKKYITDDDVAYLEKFIQQYETNPGGFIIPNGLASSAAHLAKAMVRRAEREGIACKNPTNFVSEEIIRFLNRLSDALYILALTVDEKPHIMWVQHKKM